MNNKAIIEFGFSCYPPRPSASVDNTLLDLQNSSYPTQPHSIIAKYSVLNLDMILQLKYMPIVMNPARIVSSD